MSLYDHRKKLFTCPHCGERLLLVKECDLDNPRNASPPIWKCEPCDKYYAANSIEGSGGLAIVLKEISEEK